MQELRLSGKESPITLVDNLDLSVRKLLYFFPVFLTLGRWYFPAFYLVLVFILLILEKIVFDDFRLKFSNIFAWIPVFIWGVFVVLKSQKIFNGLIYFVGIHPFYDGIAYYIGLIIVPFFIMTLLTNIDLDEDFLDNLFTVFNISGIILSTISIFVFIGSGFNTSLRINGLWPDINIVALYYTVLFFFNLAFIVNESKSKLFFFRLISLFFTAFGIFLTQTRAAWLAVVISLVVFFVKKPKIIFPALGVIAVFLILFFDVIQTRYLTFINFTTDVSTIGRFQAWYTTFLMLKENLWWGWGFDGFLYNKDSFYSGFVLFLPHSHNTFLRVILEMGLFGAIIYFFLFFKAFIINFTFKPSDENLFLKKYFNGLQLSFVSFLVMFMFEPFISLYSNASLIIWTFISLSICLKERYSTSKSDIIKNNN